MLLGEITANFLYIFFYFKTMVKKRLFWIVFLLFLPLALSLTEESLYSGIIRGGQTVTADNFEFYFQVAPEGGVLIEYDGKRTIVMESSCKVKDNLNFCVGNISFAYRNVTAWKDIYETTAEISAMKGELGITKTIEKTTLMIGETSEVELSFGNTGSKEIQNVVFKDSYPISIGVTEVVGCSFNRNDNSVEWRGDMKMGVTKTCSYNLEGLSAVEYDSKAEASYFDGLTVQNDYSDEVEITVQNYSLQVEYNLTKSRLEIGEFINTSFDLKNIRDGDISVQSFKIDIPTNFKIIKKGGWLDKKGQILSWRGSLESNEVKTFTVELQAVRTGNTPIYMEKQYKVEEFTRKFTEPLEMEVYCDCLAVNHEVPDEISPGKEIRFKVNLFNPSYANKFKDVKLGVFSNIPFADQISNFHSVFDERKSLILYDYKINVPVEGDYYYNLSVGYKSDYGQYFKLNKYISIEGGTVKEEVEEVFEEYSEEVNETSKVEPEEPEEEEIVSAENATEEEIETSSFEIEGKKSPLTTVVIVLGLLLIVGFMIGIIKFRKEKKKEEEQESKEKEDSSHDTDLSTFLILMLIVFVSSFVSVPGITGFVVYGQGIADFSSSLSVLGAMVVLAVLLLLIVHRKEPFKR